MKGLPATIYISESSKHSKWYESFVGAIGEEVPRDLVPYVRGDVLKTDLQLPPAYRTQANKWRADFYELHKELQKANKGLRRLSRKVKRLEGESNEI